MKADIRWLDDPQVFRVNRLDAHSDHKFYENKEDYKKQDQRLKQSLNGIWKFHYSVNALERPADFYQKWFNWRDTIRFIISIRCIRGKDIFTEDRQDMEKKKGKVCSARPNIIR